MFVVCNIHQVQVRIFLKIQQVFRLMLKLAMKVMPYLMWLGFLLNTIFLSLIYQVPYMTFLFLQALVLQNILLCIQPVKRTVQVLLQLQPLLFPS